MYDDNSEYWVQWCRGATCTPDKLQHQFSKCSNKTTSWYRSVPLIIRVWLCNDHAYNSNLPAGQGAPKVPLLQPLHSGKQVQDICSKWRICSKYSNILEYFKKWRFGTPWNSLPRLIMLKKEPKSWSQNVTRLKCQNFAKKWTFGFVFFHGPFGAD